MFRNDFISVQSTNHWNLWPSVFYSRCVFWHRTIYYPTALGRVQIKLEWSTNIPRYFTVICIVKKLVWEVSYTCFLCLQPSAPQESATIPARHRRHVIESDDDNEMWFWKLFLTCLELNHVFESLSPSRFKALLPVINY